MKCGFLGTCEGDKQVRGENHVCMLVGAFASFLCLALARSFMLCRGGGDFHIILPH